MSDGDGRLDSNTTHPRSGSRFGTKHSAEPADGSTNSFLGKLDYNGPGSEASKTPIGPDCPEGAMAASDSDKSILRELGTRVAEIAALPIQQETIGLWKALNGLRPTRPMVLIDQIPWHEMDVDGELALRTEDPFCQGLETHLRRTLYAWDHMRADMVVDPWIDIPRKISGAYPGIGPLEDCAVLDPANDVVGHYYIDQLQTEEDLEKIHHRGLAGCKPRSGPHRKLTRSSIGSPTSAMQGMHPGFALWDRIVEWHGVRASLSTWSTARFVHKLLTRATDAYLSLLDQLEAQELWDNRSR